MMCRGPSVPPARRPRRDHPDGSAGRPVGEAVEGVLALPLSPEERGASIRTAHIAFALFHAGHLRHVQAKFFALDADGAEPCIRYPELIAILRETGYAGRLDGEFEYFLWDDDLDAVDQIRRQQRELVRLWNS